MDFSKIPRITLIVLIIGLIIGAFFLGRSRAKVVTKIKTEYITQDPIHDSIPYPVPYVVVEPVDTFNLFREVLETGIYSDLFPKDSVWIYPTHDDTLKILKDYLAIRNYHEVLFDIDTLGKCSIDATIQMNRIRNLSYDYNPVQKQITNEVIVKPLLEPFVGLGGGYPFNLRVQAGAFLKNNWGASLEYERQFETKQNIYSVMLLKKF